MQSVPLPVVLRSSGVRATVRAGSTVPMPRLICAVLVGLASIGEVRRTNSVVGPRMVHVDVNGAAVEGPESTVRVLLGDVGTGVDPLACIVGEGVTAPFGEDEVEVCGCEGGEGGEEDEGLHFEIEGGGLVGRIEIESER